MERLPMLTDQRFHVKMATLPKPTHSMQPLSKSQLAFLQKLTG